MKKDLDFFFRGKPKTRWKAVVPRAVEECGLRDETGRTGLVGDCLSIDAALRHKIDCIHTVFMSETLRYIGL
jgi:hypothetical protein